MIELDNPAFHQITAKSVCREPFRFDRFYQDPGYLLRVAELFIDAVSSIQENEPINVLAFIKAKERAGDPGDGLLPLVASICGDERLFLSNVVVRLDRISEFNTPLSESSCLTLFGNVNSSEEISKAVSVLQNSGAEVRHVLAFSMEEGMEGQIEGVRIDSFFMQKGVVVDGDLPGRVLVPQPWLMALKEKESFSVTPQVTESTSAINPKKGLFGLFRV